MMQTEVWSQNSPVFVFVLVAFISLLALVTIALTTLASCKITAKAGYPWALGLLIVVPVASVILPLYLAYAEWPVHRKTRKLGPPYRAGRG